MTGAKCKFCGADDRDHEVMSCIRNLVSQRDDEKQRAEAAEAEARKWAKEYGNAIADTVRVEMKLRQAEAERDALRKVDDAMVGRFLRAYAECEGERPQTFTHRIGVRAALDAALAVQP